MHYENSKKKEDNEFTYQYLPWRGVLSDTFRHYGVTTEIDSEGKPQRLRFVYPNGSTKIRELADKNFWSQGDIAKAGLFGRDKFDAGSHKYVTITEGELDALSLYQALRGGPVVSVQSAATAARDAVVDREWLNSFERIYLALDADAPGREAAGRIAKLFDFGKVYQVKFSKHKDANAYLESGESDELRNIWWNSRKYLPETIISSLADFQGILESTQHKGISYPFPTLTDMTYGIRRGETILLTAQEGVGKTEVMHAIQHHLLKENEGNVGALFLEETKQRHLQALAGIELRKPVHLPDSGCSQAETMAALTKVLAKDDRLYLYSHFGSDDPEHLIDTIRFLVSACGCWCVMLDHITMAVSGLAGEDERRALDYISTRLEMMVKELDFALIIVSHVNDFGQTRGSRYISKISDLRIDLTRDVEGGSNIVDFHVSKNRFAGKTGSAGSYVFDQYTRQYTLVGGANDKIPQSEDSQRSEVISEEDRQRSDLRILQHAAA